MPPVDETNYTEDELDSANLGRDQSRCAAHHQFLKGLGCARHQETGWLGIAPNGKAVAVGTVGLGLHLAICG